MSSYELNRSRDPRQRDRSRSEIRRPNSIDTSSTSFIANQPVRSEQNAATNSAFDFFKTLGLNSQLIQALINANPPKADPIQPAPSLPQPLVNNAQEFASFLSQSYGLESPINPPVNRDPRRRPVPTDSSSRTTDSRLVLHPTPPISIEESYKQYLSSIDRTSLDGETRRRLQRIALLDGELDKLHRINIELTKTSEKRSRRRSSTKDKDSLLTENENLQHELINYLKTLKTNLLNHSR